MTPIVPTIVEDTPRRIARRRAVPVRTPRATHAVAPDTPALNRRNLRNELLALYDQYEADIRCANRIEAESVHLADEAADARRDARRRMGLIAELLDSEFPGWDTDARAARPMPGVEPARHAVASHT